MVSRVSLYLGQYYAASQLAKGDRVFVETAMRELAEADQDFRREAETALAGMTDNICQRDHVSRINRDILRKVLA